MEGKEKGELLDVIVWGATGFTGRLVGEYLVLNYGHLRVGLAGRNREKLEEIRASLLELNSSVSSSLYVLTASLSDPSSLENLVSKTKVVISAAGPFSRLGTPLVDACVKVGTHYVDTTGEAHWVRRMIERHHLEAKRKGVFIVSCCGFDSIPSDLGTLMVVEAARSDNATCTQVSTHVTNIKGGMSGGTFHSGMGFLEDLSLWELVKLMGGYYLCVGKGSGSDAENNTNSKRWLWRSFQERDGFGLGYTRDLKKWTSPFVMSAVNTKVVRRSAFLLPELYGGGDYLNFSYTEDTASSSFLFSLVFTLVFNLVLVLLLFAPCRWLAKKVAPQPGEGPTRKQQEEGSFELKLVGEAVDNQTKQGRKYLATVRGVKDPGYGETSKMVSESALCLVLDKAKLSAERSGVVTPAVAFGEVLIQRLRNAKMTWKVERLA